MIDDATGEHESAPGIRVEPDPRRPEPRGAQVDSARTRRPAFDVPRVAADTAGEPMEERERGDQDRHERREH